MDDRGIIIADKDAKYRSQVAEHFRREGYRVETTDSAVHVLCSILEKQTPVLLLGTDFDQKISSLDLIRLLKKCNRHLHVIMVSDEMPLALARKVRQEGIFYHALKPTVAGDNAELGMAVECAFAKESKREELHQQPLPPRPAAICAANAEENKPVKQPMKALPWLIGLFALVFGTSCLSLLAVESVKQGNSVAIWIFVGFCALIIVSQLLPIFRIKLPMSHSVKEAAKQEAVSPDKK